MVLKPTIASVYTTTTVLLYTTTILFATKIKSIILNHRCSPYPKKKNSHTPLTPDLEAKVTEIQIYQRFLIDTSTVSVWVKKK